MEWLAAVGAVATPVASIVDSLTGTGAAKAQAAQAASEAQTAAIQAQVQLAHEETVAKAEQTKTLATYGLIAVALCVGGYLLIKVL